MGDSCRGAYKSCTSTKQVIVQGAVFLKQVVITPTETVDGRETTVTLYDGLTSATTDERFQVSVPRQIDNNGLVKFVNAIVGVDDSSGDANPYATGSLNWIIEAVNDSIIPSLNAIAVPFPTPPFFTSGSAGDWVTFLGSPTAGNLAAAIQLVTGSYDPFNISDWTHITTDDDTEMSYDRNAAKVINFPEPGLFFPTGIVGKSLRASTGSTSSTAHVTCVYQQAPSTTIGGTMKAAFDDGDTSDPGSNQLLINQPCKIHSLHIFNDHSTEQGIKLFNGTEEIAQFYAGDNSLSQIELPKPGFIFDKNVYIRQSAYNARVRICAIYEEL